MALCLETFQPFSQHWWTPEFSMNPRKKNNLKISKIRIATNLASSLEESILPLI